MRRTLLVTLLVVVPSIAFAFEYKDISNRYIDAPFSPAEAAGISILTSLNAIEGNPDGSFAADRTLNRAEFVKIVLIPYINAHSDPFAGYHWYSRGSIVGDRCFPDVALDAWFGMYVCEAKDLGLVNGYPDGLFHPERPVNYAEALKILGELYNVKFKNAEMPAYDAWYVPYREGAIAAGVGLHAMDGQMEHLLTRGEMARLTAAYYMYSIDALDEYRAFERGETIASRSSSSISSQSSASSVSPAPQSSQRSDVGSISSFSSASSSSTPSVSLTFPAVSHFLVAGTTTPMLYDGLVQANEEVKMQSVELELFREIHSLDSLRLIDEHGKEIARLSLQSYNNLNKTKWRADFATGSYVLPGVTPVRIGVVAHMKTRNDGAVSNELFEVKTVQLFTVGTQSNVSQQIVPTDIHRPSHQTSFGRMTGVKNTLASAVSVQQGAERQLGSFALTGQMSGTTLLAKSLVFELQSTDILVSNVKIGTVSPGQQSDCASEQNEGRTYLTCLIPESLQGMSLTPVTLSVYGNTSVAAAKQSGTVKLLSPGNGAIGFAGAVNWTDGSGIFNWIEAQFPADSGPLVTVTK